MTTDQTLIEIAKPPAPLANALLRQSEEDVEALLELLFCCHQLVDDPEQEESKWYNTDTAWFVKRWYLDCKIPEALKEIAPTWEQAMAVTITWLKSWPHDCGEYDYWSHQRFDIEDETAISYFREMLKSRVPKGMLDTSSSGK